MDDRLQSWLEQELETGLSGRTGQVRPTSAQLARIVELGSSRRRGLLGGGTPFKAALVAAGAVAVTATGAFAAGTAATGSSNPLVWGQRVSDYVSQCRSSLQTGQHGLGECVSDFAQGNGPAERAQHSQAGQHGSAAPHTPGPPAGAGPGQHGNGHPPTPSARPTPADKGKRP